MQLITGSQLIKVVPNMGAARGEEMAGRIVDICPKYGINTQDILHEFIATVGHESGGFRLKAENMNYTAPRIVAVWPSRFALPVNGKLPKGKLNALLFAKNPRALANVSYGGRMGNRPNTDDGYNFRGGGYIGLTGRYIYELYRAYNSFDTVENMADAVRTDEYYALDSACWVFAVKLKLIQAAIDDDMIGIIKNVNGGLINLHDRLAYYARAKKYIV